MDVVAQAKMWSFVALTEISFEERKDKVSFFLIPLVATHGMRLDIWHVIGPRECVRDRA